MARHYRPATPAEKDARAERRIERMETLGIPLRQGLAPRKPLHILVEVDGQRFEVNGEPAHRNNQFALVLNGEPLGVGGAEAAWREIQKRRAPLLGERNLT